LTTDKTRTEQQIQGHSTASHYIVYYSTAQHGSPVGGAGSVVMITMAGEREMNC